MFDLLIFGGTTEGRKIADFCEANKRNAYLSVVSEYGREVLPSYTYVKVLEGAMDTEEMKAFVISHQIKMIIDATHPFAKIASQNIRAAARACSIPCHRLLREKSEKDKIHFTHNSSDDCIYVNSIDEAVDYLENTFGRILVTTGSKELATYCRLKDFAERLYIRILPNASMIESCEALGIPSGHICAMQGPFSKDFNIAHIKAVNAAYLVTKESGKTGGFDEKIEACLACNIKAIIIRKPFEEGLGIDDVCKLIEASSESSVSSTKKATLTLIGIGPGNLEYFTSKAITSCENAEVFIGAERMLESGRKLKKSEKTAFFNAYKADDILEIIKSHKDKNIVVLYSGDTGFYSGTSSLTKVLDKENISYTIIPGISSLQYLCSKAAVSYEDALFLTAHGRKPDLELLKNHEKVFFLTGGDNGSGELLKTLNAMGYGTWTAYVGERLSYPEEKISQGRVCDLAGEHFDRLAAILLVDSERSSRND